MSKVKYVTVLLISLVVLALGKPAYADGSNTIPVLWVHGITPSPGCPGIHSAEQAAPLKSVLQANGYTGPVIGIDYYCGDSTGVSIIGAGDPTYMPTTANNYNATTPIEKLANDLAWYIYKTYTIKGQTVNIAAHSMGGLITKFAVTHVGKPSFPPSLLVSNVVTFSTPYGGVNKNPYAPYFSDSFYTLTWCGSYAECTELTPGSAFLKDLATQNTPVGVDWTTIGGGPKDIMTYASSSATNANHKVDYYSGLPVNYDHTAYITDTSAALNSIMRYTNVGQSTVSIINGAHSLQWGYRALSTNTW